MGVYSSKKVALENFKETRAYTPGSGSDISVRGDADIRNTLILVDASILHTVFEVVCGTTPSAPSSFFVARTRAFLSTQLFSEYMRG